MMSWRITCAFITLCVIWGIPYFLIKISLAELSPAVVAWGRITLGALILLPIAWHRGVLPAVMRHKGWVAAFAVAELIIPFSMVALGESWLSSSLAGILIATVPLVVLLIGPAFGIRETLNARRIAGLVMGFVGVVAMLGIDTTHTAQQWLGIGCLMLAVLGYAVGPLIVQRHLADVDELGAVATSLCIASVVLLPFAVLTFPARMPSTTVLLSTATLGVVSTALALMLFFYLIHAAGAARAAIVAYINPAIAALLGVLVLHEPFGIGSVIGLSMILGGSWLATRRA